MIRLGLARTTITPPLGIYLAGYGDREGGCKSVRDELTATAMCWESGNSRVAVVSVDMLGLNEELHRRIGKTVGLRLKLNGIFLCCSHTHSGPIGWAPERISPWLILKECLFRLAALPAGSRQPSGWLANKRYIDSLVIKISDLIIEAASDTEEIEFFSGTATLNLGLNRREKTDSGEVVIGRNEEGAAPSALTAVQARRISDGEAVLTMVNYDCHPVIFGPENYAVSADWVGEMRRNVEKNVPGLCIYIQGGCGNINPATMNHDGGDMEKIVVEAGNAVADAVLQALGNMSFIAGEDLAVMEQSADIRIEPGPGYRTSLSKYAGMPRWIVDPVLHFRYPWKTLIERGADGEVTTPVHCGLVRLGGISIGCLSMEPFFETAETVRALLPGIAIFSGYTNGLTGYLPTTDAADEGGYEAEASPYMYRLPGLLDKQAEPAVIEAFRSLVEYSPAPAAGIRGMRPDDENAVQNICHKTFYGCPDFPYPELIGYRWAAWYVRHASAFSFAAVDSQDRAVGYILCAPDSMTYRDSYQAEIVPLIREAVGRLKISHPELYRRYRRSFLPPVNEYSLPLLKRITREYPAHLHVDLLPDYQKSGLGGKLMTALLQKLKTEGIQGVHLIVGSSNANAVGFYRRFGFEIISTRTKSMFKIYIMGLKL